MVRGEVLLLQKAAQSNFTWRPTKHHCGCRQLPVAASIWSEDRAGTRAAVAHLGVLGSGDSPVVSRARGA